MRKIFKFFRRWFWIFILFIQTKIENVRHCSSFSEDLKACPCHFNPLLHVLIIEIMIWHCLVAIWDLKLYVMTANGNPRFHALCWQPPKLNQSFRSQIDTLHCPIMISWLVTCSWGLKWLEQAFKLSKKLEKWSTWPKFLERQKWCLRSFCNFFSFFFVGNFKSLISTKPKSKPLHLIQNFVSFSKMPDFFT